MQENEVVNLNGLPCKYAPTEKFVQKDVRRTLTHGDNYVVWRRYKDGLDTWLCIIWHENWDNGRRASNSDFCRSYLREDVEKWAKSTLLRIHHPYSVCESVHEDFESLATDYEFSF